MTQYKYDDILPIYNKYSKMTDDKLQDALDAITIVEELNNDLTMLLSKDKKKLKRYESYQLLCRSIKRYRC